MKIAVVGATGQVGSKMLQVLSERKFPVSELLPIASEESLGKEIEFNQKKIKVIGMASAIAAKPDIALFSAGSEISLEWAPKFASAGITVIDNSSAWRMHPQIQLVVPEINGDVLTVDDKIIANPNCSTIQMVMALNPLHKVYKIKRIVVSTYQSVSGSGVKSVRQLSNEREEAFFPSEGQTHEKVYRYPIDLNVIPQVDIFMENAYTREEMKMLNETRKIMRDETIRLTATAVRVPVFYCHSESVNVEFEHDFDVREIKEILAHTKGLTLRDDIGKFEYPMPLHAEDKDDVYVGRIRRDESQLKSLNLWIVSDNLRKGAATNAVQIAETLVEKNLI